MPIYECHRCSFVFEMEEELFNEGGMFFGKICPHCGSKNVQER